MTDTDYADDVALLINTPTQAESLLHSLEKEELASTWMFETRSQLEFKWQSSEINWPMCSNIKSTESHVIICIEKVWSRYWQVVDHMEIWPL